jgi:hypothetical protein
LDWNTLTKLCREAFRDAVNDWLGKARIRGGQVNGPNAILMPGCLASDANIEATILMKLVPAQAPPEIARAFAKELAGAWNAWASGFQLQMPGAYPPFAAFPGPVAPPMPTSRPFPVALGASPGEVGLKSTVLALKLTQVVRPYSGKLTGSADQALKTFAAWVESSFTEWKSMAMLTGVQGKGPVPTFAPPYVPVGPVIGGDMLSVGPVFAGPRFGKIVV